MESLKKKMKGKCALCNSEATSTCSKCKSTHYCSRNCQKSDWKNHKKTCNPVLGQIQTPVVESPLLAEIIENLPLDILAMIFKKLSSLKDIVSCYKTCVRWKQTIEKLFENKSKVLIASGKPFENGKYVEIIDLINGRFKHVAEITEIEGLNGTLIGSCIQDQVVICGGTSQEYIVLGKPNKTLKLLEDRDEASVGVVINDKQIWLTGGRIKGSGIINQGGRIILTGGDFKKSTEFVSLDQPPMQGPNLPFAISGHVMIQVDRKNLYMIGGGIKSDNDDDSGKDKNKTWILDPSDNYKIKKGPSLNCGRRSAACGKMIINGRIFIVVVGGYGKIIENHNPYLFNMDGSPCNRPGYSMGPIFSVELLDTTSPEAGWKMGPKLPYEELTGDYTITTSPTGKGILLIGGEKDSSSHEWVGRDVSKHILELSGDSFDTLKWTVLKQKLQYPRSKHLAIPITLNAYNIFSNTFKK